MSSSKAIDHDRGRYYSYYGSNTMKVTSKGQVTIPQELRRKYQIDAHAEVDFVEEDGKIVVRVARKSPSPFRKLLGKGDVRMSTEEILRMTRGR
jgi:AbrB family looped-hinge helix DNA binding protein